MPPSSLSLVISLISLSHASYDDCGSYFSNYGVTFDLSPLTLTDQTNLSYYLVKHETANYEFLFNFCADLITMPFPSACNWEDRSVKDRSGSEISRPKNTTAMAWQTVLGGNGFCFRISGPRMSEENKYNTSDLITYDLIDPDDPSYGILMHYDYGDWDSGCPWLTNRQFHIAIVCDPSIDNIPDEGEIITEPDYCEYYMEIKSVYGCPLECGRDENNTLCAGNGLCGYDGTKQTAMCKCFAGFGGDICNETATFEADISWYDAIGCESNSTYSFEFDTMYGSPIHYDLQWFIDGYMISSNGNKHYKFNSSGSSNYYLNLFESQPKDTSICNNNPPDYQYGLLYQASKTDSNAPCYSLGRTIANISLFEPTLPDRGIHISLENGDSMYCDGNEPRQSDIYLICPSSSGKREQYEGNDGLNNVYLEYLFSEPGACRYEIEIYTAAACPCQCVSYDGFKDSISVCNGNGMCGYDKVLDFSRCMCNENMKINDPQDVGCKHPNATYAPTNDPTTYTPTNDPTELPTQPPTSPSITRIECGDYYKGGIDNAYDNDTFTFSVYSPFGSKVIFDACDSQFDTHLFLDYGGGRVYQNDDHNSQCGSVGPSYLEAAGVYPDRNYTLIVKGVGSSYGRYFLNVTCEDLTEWPTSDPTLSPTPRPTEGYSLEGAWTKYDWHSDELYQVKISVSAMCDFVKFEFVTSAGCINSWFGFGIGGNYGFNDDDPDDNMNGYALISFTGGIPDGYNQVYESSLTPGQIPTPQTIQNLRNCSVEIRNCMQYIVCYRDFMSSDKDNDYYMFKQGINDIIVAYGDTMNATFMPMKHVMGNARQSFLYLDGESMCYITPTTTDIEEDTTTITITTTTVEVTNDDLNNDSKEICETHGTWMIIAIVFIILFGLILICLLYKIYVTRNKATVRTQGFMHGQRVNSADNIGNDGGNEMAKMINTNDGGAELGTTNATDDLL